MKQNRVNIILFILLIVMASMARIINAGMNVPNIAPLIAISLFGGAVIKNNRLLVFFVPLYGQFIADLYFGIFTSIPAFYGVAGMVFNYGGLLAAAAIGMGIKMKPLNILLNTFGAATLFFILSNFGFYLQGWNTYSFGGLVKTYIDGIPFFKYTLVGNMVCSSVLFGSYFLLKQFSYKLQKANA